MPCASIVWQFPKLPIMSSTRRTCKTESKTVSDSHTDAHPQITATVKPLDRASLMKVKSEQQRAFIRQMRAKKVPIANTPVSGE